MNLRRLLPVRLRHHSRVLAVQCGQCDRWVKPRHFRIPAFICRDCETLPDFQDWKPAAAPATDNPSTELAHTW